MIKDKFNRSGKEQYRQLDTPKTEEKTTTVNTEGNKSEAPKKKKNIPEKILLFCILFLSYRWIFEDDRFTFAVAGLGYMALTGSGYFFGKCR